MESNLRSSKFHAIAISPTTRAYVLVAGSLGMTDTDQERDTYTEAETIARREAALKRMLATPHKPHKAVSPAADKGRGRKSTRS